MSDTQVIKAECKECGNTDEVEVDGVVYMQSEIGGRENKLPSGENLGVYIPKDFGKCLELGSLKLRSKQAKKLAV